MTDLDERRQWMEALHEYGNDQDRLFGLVASLANLLDKDLVVETMQSVLGIYARETGQGMIFSQNTEKAEHIEPPELQADIEVEETRSRPHLTIVK